MKISVALATYNGSEYIKELLNSLKNQTKQGFEVIICDDCSSDNTLEIANEFAKNTTLTCKVFKNTNNLGFKANFKQAISNCTGDIIFLCDQDDVWHQDKIKTVTEFFATHKDCLLVASSFCLTNEKGQEIKSAQKGANYGLIKANVKGGESVKIPLKAVLHSNIAPGCAVAIKKELAKEFCQKSESILPHDWELALVASAKDGLYFLNEKLVYYRQHQNNTLGFNGKKQNREEIALEKYGAVAEVCKYENKNALKEFLEKRYNCLKNKNLKGLIKILFNKNYSFFSLKEKLGDILYIIK